MLRLVGSAILLSLAAGCGSQDNASSSANAANNGVDYRQRIAEMPEGPREALFLRAIVGAHLPCQQIDSATAGTDSSGTPVWNVHCSGGHERTVIIAEDGTARILDADPPSVAGNSQ